MQKIIIGIILLCIALFAILFFMIKDIDTTKPGQYYFCKSKNESQKKGFYIVDIKLSKRSILLKNNKIDITDAWVEKLKQYDSHGNLMILNIKEKGFIMKTGEIDRELFSIKMENGRIIPNSMIVIGQGDATTLSDTFSLYFYDKKSNALLDSLQIRL